MNVRVRSIGAIQTAKTLAVIYGAVGIVAGIVACLAIISEPFHTNDYWGATALLALIAIPIGYALVGFVGVVISAWIYNIVAAKTGGIEFTLTNLDTNLE
jgi:uncharacterized membrane protein YhaH (DUF805 family)